MNATTAGSSHDIGPSARATSRPSGSIQHSVRVNDQWRICFAWRDSEAWDVEIIDYH